jgi:homoserine O-acetyltransferase/O-succinyltransferase
VQPASLRTAVQLLYFMGSNPLQRQQATPTLASSDAALDAYVNEGLKKADANDILFQVDASHDYDPAPGLGKIKAPLLAVNSADDLINPPELGILEQGIKKVARGSAVVLPYTPETRGHGSHTIAALWKQYLHQLLEQSAR